jgi:hypothetical protein
MIHDVMYLVLVHSLLSTIQQSNEEAMQKHGTTCPCILRCSATTPSRNTIVSYDVVESPRKSAVDQSNLDTGD